MAQILVTLLFSAVLFAAARLMLRELKRPLVKGPACWDDMLFDSLCDGDHGQRRMVTVRRAARRPLRINQPVPLSSAA